MIPERLSHYRVLKKIGAGGMGEVYLARDARLDRTVVLKILPAEFAERRDRLERFVREAKAASALKHPNVAHIYEIGESSGVHFIAMEHVEGQTVSAMLKGQPLKTSEILDLAIQVADALDEAHGKGIVHRDIKPGNVMVTPRGQVKVLDFGLAKVTRPEEATAGSELPTQAKTQNGVVLGTVQYMSPEQALGREVDARSDVFSMGVVLYELTTGRVPFSGSTPTETLQSIINHQPEAIARFNYRAPSELERVIRKCLEKDAERRYQSVRELLVDLRNLKRDSESGGVAPGAQARPRRWLYAGVAIVLGLVGFGGYLFLDRSGPAIDSLAVLPFESTAQDSETEYLGDDIMENIIVALSRLPDVRVISRGSVARYKGTGAAPETVGRELGVDAVVMGRLVQRGDNLAVTAELVSTRDSTLLWSEQYSRRLADLFDIQHEIAREIASSLEVRLTEDIARDLARRYTDNLEAYRAYLRGRYHLHRRTETDFHLAIEFFRQAIDSDQSYALAYAGLADTYSLLGHYAFLSPNEAFQQAGEFVQRGLEIDDSLAEIHTSAGFLAYNEWRWQESEQLFRRAIEIDPNYVIGHYWYSLVLTALGRHDEAVASTQKAVERDPLSPFVNMVLGWNYLHGGYLNQAEVQLEKSLQLDASLAQGHRYLGQTYVRKAMYDEAVQEYLKAAELSGGSLGLGELGHVYAISGQGEKAREVLDRLNELSEKTYVTSLEAARVHAGLEELDRCFELLERAFDEKPGELTFLRWTPVGDTLKGDPRFHDLVRRMGLSF